jgi:hypothetical protein
LISGGAALVWGGRLGVSGVLVFGGFSHEMYGIQ